MRSVEDNMDRLTIPDVKVDAHTTRRTMIDAEAVKERAMEMYWKLKKYEDTGLTPAEVHSMSAEWCAMMSVFNGIGSYDRLRELADAEKEGRVVVLPCRVGDTLYQLSSAYTECTVYGVRKDNYCCEGCEVPCDSHEVIFIDTIRPSSLVATIRCCEELGKTVFRTREEAEKALEAAKNEY